MITRDNIQSVVDGLTAAEKKRIKSCNWEFVVIELYVFNAGSFSTAKLTNYYERYQNVSNYGGCILSIDDPVFHKIFNK